MKLDAHFVRKRGDKPRTVTVPAVLKKALAASAGAKTAFDRLSYSHKKEYVLWITDAKQEETRERRLKKLVSLLLAKERSKA